MQHECFNLKKRSRIVLVQGQNGRTLRNRMSSLLQNDRQHTHLSLSTRLRISDCATVLEVIVNPTASLEYPSLILTHFHSLSLCHKVVHLIKVQILVGGALVLGQLGMVLLVLLPSGKSAQDGRHSRQLRRGQVDVGALPKAVGEVARGSRDHRGVVCHTRLVAHAQGTPRHLRAGAGLAVDGVVALLGQLLFIHLRGWGNPPQTPSRHGKKNTGILFWVG